MTATVVTKKPIKMPLPATVRAMLMKMRMKERVPKPMRHLSFFTILAGPDLTNLAIPNEAVTIEVEKVVKKRVSAVTGLSHGSERGFWLRSRMINNI